MHDGRVQLTVLTQIWTIVYLYRPVYLNCQTDQQNKSIYVYLPCARFTHFGGNDGG